MADETCFPGRGFPHPPSCPELSSAAVFAQVPILLAATALLLGATALLLAGCSSAVEWLGVRLLYEKVATPVVHVTNVAWEGR